MMAGGSSATVIGGCGGDDVGAGEQNRRFVPRLPPSYGRPHHPYAAMMYPEFQFRPPPPSYQASMQEYRLRLLLLDRHPAAGACPGAGIAASSIPALSPPPTYRSHAASLLRYHSLILDTYGRLHFNIYPIFQLEIVERRPYNMND